MRLASVKSPSSIPSDPIESLEQELESFTAELTIDPWVADHNCPFRKLKFGNLGLDLLVFQSNLLDSYDLASICCAVNVWTESKIAFDLSSTQTNNGFVEFILDFCQQRTFFFFGFSSTELTVLRM